MTITADLMEHVGELALDMAKGYRKQLRTQFSGLGPGQSYMTDAEHKAWFEMHAQGWWESHPAPADPVTGQVPIDPMTGKPAELRKFRDGPNWVLALPHVEGGQAEIDRYLRTQRKERMRTMGTMGERMVA